MPDFSTDGPIADATLPMVAKVAMTKFLLLSYKRPLRAPSKSAGKYLQMNYQPKKIIKMKEENKKQKQGGKMSQ